jgi:hypothetical protein
MIWKFCLGLDDSSNTGHNDQLFFVIRIIRVSLEAVEEPDNLKSLYGPKTGNMFLSVCETMKERDLSCTTLGGVVGNRWGFKYDW